MRKLRHPPQTTIVELAAFHQRLHEPAHRRRLQSLDREIRRQTLFVRAKFVAAQPLIPPHRTPPRHYLYPPISQNPPHYLELLAQRTHIRAINLRHRHAIARRLEFAPPKIRRNKHVILRHLNRRHRPHKRFRRHDNRFQRLLSRQIHPVTQFHLVPPPKRINRLLVHVAPLTARLEPQSLLYRQHFASIQISIRSYCHAAS